VTVTVVSKQDWKVIAFDGDGNEVAGDAAAEGTTLTLAGKGITTIEVYGEGESGVAEVCVPGAGPAGASGAVLAWQPGREDRLTPPDVVGILPGGGEEPWKPSLKVGRRCATVVYRAPGPGPWTGFKIAPAPGRRVTVVGSCGVRWHEELEVRQAEEHRNDV
jgi:hypothetical protein